MKGAHPRPVPRRDSERTHVHLDAPCLLTQNYVRIEQLLVLAAFDSPATAEEAAKVFAEVTARLDSDEKILHAPAEQALGGMVRWQRTLHSRVRRALRHLVQAEFDGRSRIRGLRILREVFGRYSRFEQSVVIPALKTAMNADCVQATETTAQNPSSIPNGSSR